MLENGLNYMLNLDKVYILKIIIKTKLIVFSFAFASENNRKLQRQRKFTMYLAKYDFESIFMEAEFGDCMIE